MPGNPLVNPTNVTAIYRLEQKPTFGYGVNDFCGIFSNVTNANEVIGLKEGSKVEYQGSATQEWSNAAALNIDSIITTGSDRIGFTGNITNNNAGITISNSANLTFTSNLTLSNTNGFDLTGTKLTVNGNNLSIPSNLNINNFNVSTLIVDGNLIATGQNVNTSNLTGTTSTLTTDTLTNVQLLQVNTLAPGTTSNDPPISISDGLSTDGFNITNYHMIRGERLTVNTANYTMNASDLDKQIFIDTPTVDITFPTGASITSTHTQIVAQACFSVMMINNRTTAIRIFGNTNTLLRASELWLPAERASEIVVYYDGTNYYLHIRDLWVSDLSKETYTINSGTITDTISNAGNTTASGAVNIGTGDISTTGNVSANTIDVTNNITTTNLNFPSGTHNINGIVTASNELAGSNTNYVGMSIVGNNVSLLTETHLLSPIIEFSNDIAQTVLFPSSNAAEFPATEQDGTIWSYTFNNIGGTDVIFANSTDDYIQFIGWEFNNPDDGGLDTAGSNAARTLKAGHSKQFLFNKENNVIKVYHLGITLANYNKV